MSTPTKLQVLLSKKRYLTLELQQVTAQHGEYYTEFVKHVKALEQTHDTQILQETEKKVKKSSNTDDIDILVKSLYRKIANAAHPDKTGGDIDKAKLYKEATVAKKINSVTDILDICDQLKVIIPPLDAKYYRMIQSDLEKLEQQIIQLRASDCYVWGEADDCLKGSMDKHILNPPNENK